MDVINGACSARGRRPPSVPPRQVSPASSPDRAPASALRLPDGVSVDDVYAVVARATASTTLGRSEQLVRFLRFVVDETLAGRGHLLKEYTIGVEALGRPARFDPAADSVVRVQARQLRFKLEEYARGEGQSDPLYIELPKGSYIPAFVARTSAASAEGSVDVPIARPVSRRRGAFAWALGGGAFGAALLAGFALTHLYARDVPPAAFAPERGLVVLPFLNLTGDSSADYISGGVTDELTAALAALPDERVVARTSAFQYRTHPADARTIGRQLGVDRIVEGSVRESGDTLRITVQLERTSDGAHIWSASFDEQSDNLLLAEETVARAVVGAFGRTVSPALGLAAPRAPTSDATAYAAYLKARYYSNRRDIGSMNRAIESFSEAIARDSNFALAYSGLAAAHATMAINSQTPPGVGPPLAEAAAEAALRRDSTLGEAHATLGVMRAFAHWDWRGADAEFRRAIALSPNAASAHSEYAVTLIARGSFDAALDQLRYAQRLDPLSLPIAYSIGETMFYARRWSDALAQARTIHDLDSTYLAYYNLFWRIDVETGRYAAALEAMRKQGDTLAMPIVLARMGKVADAKALADREARVAGGGAPYFVACLYAETGQRDSAFAWLERAYKRGQIDIVSMGVDPEMDPLRADRRFGVLLGKIGLEEKIADR